MEHCSKCKGKQVTGAKKILKIGLKTREASSEAASSHIKGTKDTRTKT